MIENFKTYDYTIGDIIFAWTSLIILALNILILEGWLIAIYDFAAHPTLVGIYRVTLS